MLTVLGLAWGLGCGLLLVGYGFYFRRTGFSFRHPAAYVFYLIAVVAALLPLWFHGDSGGNSLRFVDGVWLGTLSSACAAFVYALFVYWYNAKVDDGLLIEVREYMTEKNRRKGLTDEPGRQRIERWTQPRAFAQQVFFTLAMVGLVSSVVGVAWLT